MAVVAGLPVSSEQLSSPIGSIQARTTVDPGISMRRTRAETVSDDAQVNPRHVAAEHAQAEQLQQLAEHRNLQTVETLATDAVVKQRGARLLVEQTRTLNDEKEIPAPFATMQKPIDDALAIAAIPLSSIEPNSALIEHDRAVVLLNTGVMDSRQAFEIFSSRSIRHANEWRTGAHLQQLGQIDVEIRSDRLAGLQVIADTRDSDERLAGPASSSDDVAGHGQVT